MKSYNVKSNAKRVARSLAAKFSGYIAVEPVPVSEGAREWFPAVAAPTNLIAEGVPDEISSTAYVNGQVAAHSEAETEQPAVQSRSFTFRKPDNGDEVKGADAIADMAANLPPPVQSTREEIEARRRERRERLEREKVEGTRTAAGEKAKPSRTTKADIIIGLVSRPGGATFKELMDATGWQQHTLRGYIAGTLRKRGHNIELRKIKDEESSYVIPALSDEDNEASE